MESSGASTFLSVTGVLIMIFGVLGSLVAGMGFVFFVVGCLSSLIVGMLLFCIAKILNIVSYNRTQIDAINLKLDQIITEEVSE